MTPMINNILKLFMILFLLSGDVFASPHQEEISVQHIRSIYRDIKSGKLPLLGDKEIYIRSEQAGDRLTADIYAIARHGFDDICQAISTPENWCEFAPLHLNIKACTCSRGVQPVITFYAGRKFYNPPEEAYELKYLFRVTESKADRFRVVLSAEDGPWGTNDYVIMVEAVLIEGQTLLHMGLSYETSFLSRFATNAYLATIGSEKIGFSTIEQQDVGPVHIAGLKGIIERNAMRYFLALSVYLDTLDLDPAEAFNHRAEAWFELTEAYAMQLHELEQQEYLEAKRRERLNQQALQRQIDSEP